MQVQKAGRVGEEPVQIPETEEKEVNAEVGLEWRKYIGVCENCRRMLYEHSKRYWVRFNHDSYCFCENCVTVIEPKEET